MHITVVILTVFHILVDLEFVQIVKHSKSVAVRFMLNQPRRWTVSLYLSHVTLYRHMLNSLLCQKIFAEA